MFQSDQFLYPAIIYTIKYKKTENFYQDKNIKYTFVEKFVERALLWEITLQRSNLKRVPKQVQNLNGTKIKKYYGKEFLRKKY